MSQRSVAGSAAHRASETPIVRNGSRASGMAWAEAHASSRVPHVAIDHRKANKSNTTYCMSLYSYLRWQCENENIIYG